VAGRGADSNGPGSKGMYVMVVTQMGRIDIAAIETARRG
jgi:hypothetical protein